MHRHGAALCSRRRATDQDIIHVNDRKAASSTAKNTCREQHLPCHPTCLLQKLDGWDRRLCCRDLHLRTWNAWRACSGADARSTCKHSGHEGSSEITIQRRLSGTVARLPSRQRRSRCPSGWATWWPPPASVGRPRERHARPVLGRCLPRPLWPLPALAA